MEYYILGTCLTTAIRVKMFVKVKYFNFAGSKTNNTDL